MDTKNSKLSAAALTGLIIAIIGLLLSAIPVINNFAFVLAILGLIFGIVGLLAVKKGKRTGKKIAVTAVVISIVAFVIVLASQALYGAAIDEVSKSVDEASTSLDKMAGDSTDELLKNDVSVEVGEFTVTTDEYGFSTTALPVTVNNKNAEPKSYSIQIEAVDESGNRIVDDYVSANDLGADQTQKFEVFQFVESEKIEKMKVAEFKIVSVSQF